MDNKTTADYNFQIIITNISYNNCKECKYFHTKNDNCLCGNINPNEDNCIVIKEFAEKNNER